MVQVEEESIDYLIKTIPISLDITKDNIKEIGLFYLPYSTGFEIECNIIKNYNKDFLFPYIIDKDINNDGELRFHIPNGIEGITCLYYISLWLKDNALFNKESGIHYHIDFSDYYNLLSTTFIDNNSNYILTELDTWNYKGTFNPRKCVFSESRNWVRFKESTKTMEFRIGEMTFDYSLLFKRIIHCNSIVYSLKNLLINPYYLYEKDNIKEILNNRIIKK